MNFIDKIECTDKPMELKYCERCGGLFLSAWSKPCVLWGLYGALGCIVVNNRPTQRLEKPASAKVAHIGNSSEQD